ncbi:hypothetical protein OROHE_016267 [Orobanche hederae]
MKRYQREMKEHTLDDVDKMALLLSYSPSSSNSFANPIRNESFDDPEHRKHSASTCHAPDDDRDDHVLLSSKDTARATPWELDNPRDYKHSK